MFRSEGDSVRKDHKRAAIVVQALNFAYPSLPVVSDFNLCVNVGETVALLGPSGCGKSTLLRIIAGLEAAQKGTVCFPRAEDGIRNGSLRLLFQDYDAFPWLTVQDNLMTGGGSTPRPSLQAVEGLLEKVGLNTYKRKYPAELSGGMRKRLALARCLISSPNVLLLDEPFASLDVDTRYDMYDLVQELSCEMSTSMILVTHDLSESVFLADRIIVGTARPMSVKREMHVEFPRPRTRSLMNDPRFLSTVQELRILVTSEVPDRREEPGRQGSFSRDHEQLLRIREILQDTSKITKLTAEEVLAYIRDCEQRISQVQMGGRSHSLALLSLLLWYSAGHDDVSRAMMGGLERVASMALRSAVDPSLVQPEWAVILLGVLVAQWSNIDNAWEQRSQRDAFLSQVRVMLDLFRSEGMRLPLPTKIAAQQVIEAWDLQFRDGLSKAVHEALKAWPSTQSLESLAQDELASRLAALANRLPANVNVEELALYRLFLERQGDWASLDTLGDKLK